MQQTKNREAYQVAKKRIQLQGQVRGDSVWDQTSGTTAFGSVPTLGNWSDSLPLDPDGDLNLDTDNVDSL